MKVVFRIDTDEINEVFLPKLEKLDLKQSDDILWEQLHKLCLDTISFEIEFNQEFEEMGIVVTAIEPETIH